MEQLVRIGDKLVDRRRLYLAIDEILELRSGGVSQAEVAERLGTERTVISRLEALGEVHRGARLALVGFPIGNIPEVMAAAHEEGVEYVFLLGEQERWRFLEDRNGAELVNEVMQMTAELQTYDSVIFMGSDMRVRLAHALLGQRVVCLEIGASPIRKDYQVDVSELRLLINQVKDVS